MKRQVAKIIIVAMIFVSGCVGFQMHELTKLNMRQEKYEYEYGT